MFQLHIDLGLVVTWPQFLIEEERVFHNAESLNPVKIHIGRAVCS